MFSAKLKDLAEKLSVASVKQFLAPYETIKFGESLNKNEWYTSPELISLYGTEVWEQMTEEEKKALSFYEAVNFYSINVHGEKSLIEGLARRLYLKDNESVSNYIHHFLDEENKHMIYFGTFCMKYANKIYPDRKLDFPKEYVEGEEDLLFFAKVFIFEEIVGTFNKRMAQDMSLNTLAREINYNHHKEETRHLVFGKDMVKELYQIHSPKWSQEKKQEISDYLKSFIVLAWREYYNPSVYQDCKLKNPFELVGTAWNSPHSQQLRTQISASAIKFLKDNQLLLESPELT